MKKLSLIDKILYLINSLLAVLLLASYIIPYLSPRFTAIVSVLSLGMPPLIIANLIFGIYWLLKFKKQVTVSLVVLLLGYNHFNAFIQFGEKDGPKDGLKFLSYNVRLYNVFKWSQEKDIPKKMSAFFKEQNADIMCFQEVHKDVNPAKSYKYSYSYHNNGSYIGLAIYSNHKITNKGSLSFEKTGNNAIYADIKIEKDTVRVYNFHMESLRIDKNKENFGEKDSETLLKRFTSAFTIQEKQVHQIKNHVRDCPYKTIFMGDFNNTAFSWMYKELSKGKNDAFVEAGKGLGKSFDFIFPFRIDFILADSAFEIQDFKTYKLTYSDHYPIVARIKIDQTPDL